MPDKCSETDPFVRLDCPAEWEYASQRMVVLVETAFRIGVTAFRLHSPVQVTLAIRRDKVGYMMADWQLSTIDAGLPYHPNFSVWLLSAYFGLAHEVGHLLWHSGPLTLREAWGHYFALHVLQARETRQALPNWCDRVLRSKDRWFSQGILHIQRYMASPVDRAIAHLTHVFRQAGKERVAAFVTATPEMMDYVSLLSQFSQHFNIPERTCQGWLLDE